MAEPSERRTRWDWILGPFIVLVLLAGATFAVLWPEWRQSIRTENESNASDTLKTILCAAEADFRANDRDGNGVNDFWTGDVAGLFRLGLIDRAIAEADARPLNPLVPHPIPYKGYYFIAMNMDESETPHEDLQQETDKKSGKVHHPSKFGFCAYPAKPGASGRFLYIINEGNTILRRAIIADEIIDYWPSENDLKREWGKIG